MRKSCAALTLAAVAFQAAGFTSPLHSSCLRCTQQCAFSRQTIHNGVRRSQRRPLYMVMEKRRKELDVVRYTEKFTADHGELAAKEETELARQQPPEDGDGWDYWKYRLILLGVAALWGTNFGTVKYMQMADVTPAAAAVSRFMIAAAAMSPFLIKQEKAVLQAGFECGLWIALGYITQSIGLQDTDSNKSAFICSLTVVIVPLINWLGGQGIKINNGLAAFLALLGTGVLELGDASTPTIGDLWSLGQPIGFGIAFTRIEYYAEKFPGRALPLAASQLLAVAAVSLAWVLVDGGGALPDFSFLQDPRVLLASLYTGLITTALAVYMETIALEFVSAAEMSVTFSLEPIFATGFSSVLLGEQLGPQAALGALFIFAACLTAQGPKLLQLVQNANKSKSE